MNHLPRRTAAALAAVLAAGVALTGCSSTSSTATAASGSSASSVAAAPSPSPLSSAPPSVAPSSGAASSGTASSGAASSGTASSASATPATLKGVCPDTVSIQTDWNPESEHGGLYQLIGPNPTIDSDKKRVSGELYSQGKDMGIKFEVRSGGPAIGFQTVTSQLYSDKGLTMGYVNTDEAIQLSAKQPTIAVFAPLEKNP
ncbi:hypothetical protein [Nakamurella sp. PAMC28650]|uniref:hypothetical protein n=1 Tax=Nakamurella sp. PAMC28650 TaxID=2762325 RepID=UPI001C9B420C|nr:hypothetical protein [Nakamurella sp. PAMC28650]